MSLDINPASEVGKALHRAIQVDLAERGWASADDDLLAEFVVVMLQNHKTAAQVSGELAELVGADYDASFVTWLWTTAEALLRGEAAPVKEERRSASPARVRSPVRERESRRSRSPVRNAPRGGSSYVPQQHQQAPPRARRAEPERGGGALFARALGRAGRQEAAPLRSGGEEVKREYPESGEQMDQQMGNGLPPPRAPRGMNAGLRDYAAPPAPSASAPSILSRFAVPDPRASAFTPASQGAAMPTAAAATAEGSATSLLARLDPMLPLNALPVTSVPSAPAQHSAPWPSTPSDASLCRYGLRCTNPLCVFSHASAAAIASSSSSSSNGMAVDEPLVLNASPCRFQAACTRADCERSHVSPAQAVLAKKNGGAPAAAAAPAANATQECRYGARCTRADCRYAHPGKPTSGASTETCRFGVGCTRADCKFAHPQGRTLDIAPPDTEMRDAKHVSERLRRFARAGEGEGEVERIIPGEA
ncbi:hypothetical protein FA09DRAFT_339173 [Tilletiopsis washingtonensis]|uniref:C3H1-type domain-containing protein n=1 Tax=Tilletiopsis washingtonensis TaxID=58919 RepID=A0A316Z9Q5_9BASI|nr:hypothetical protein FA09DRAFT_339173 [Tilletiopsis washingtonensis]PWN97682.1 hypothetical protein FA09DRAFT_339173 [Tilletiopsis washingtonensis]